MTDPSRGKQRFNVLHVINSLGVSGGAEQQLVSNLQHFRDPDLVHHVAYVYEYDFETRTQLVSQVAESLHGLLPPGSKRSRWRAIRAVDRVVRDLQPDLIHCSLADAALAARVVGRLRHVPVVESLVNIAHDPVRLIDNPAVSRWKLAAHRVLDRVTMRWVTSFHALSDVVARSWVDSVGIPPDKIHVIPRGVDPARLKAAAAAGPGRAELAQECGFSESAKIILNVGRQEPQKGQRYLIEALPEILRAEPDAVLLIAGRPGNSSASLVDTAKRLGVESRVRFLGRRSDVAALVVAADVFVFPSLFEGLGVSLLEALALGAAVATTDVEPMNEIVHDGENGRLFPSRDQGAIAFVVTELLADSEQRGRLAKAGTDSIRHGFSSTSVARELERLYDGVLRVTLRGAGRRRRAP